MRRSLRSARGRRGRYWAVAACAAVALCAGLLAAIPRGPGSGESLGDVALSDSTPPQTPPSVITNNIQGSTTGGDSKWSTMVAGFAATSDVVLLQEVGPSGPPNSKEARALLTDGNLVRRFKWTPVNGRPSLVYFTQTDDNGGTGTGGRVNIAIVTAASNPPSEVRVVANPVDAGRVALGVRFGNNWFFTVHGLSGQRTSNNGVSMGGGDSGALVTAIATAVGNWGASRGVRYTYTIGGDFNRPPSALRPLIPSTANILATGRATHVLGGELDYFVTNDSARGDPASPAGTATLMNGSQSDHFPVMLGAMRAGAGLPQPKFLVDGDNVREYATKFWATIGPLLFTATASLLSRSPDFVGDQTSSGGIPDEGSDGAEISAIAAQDSTAIPKYSPNVVLLQAGTWDIQDGDSAGASGRLSALIDQVQAADPTAVVLVATLGPTANSAAEPEVTEYNTAVQELVAARVAAGQHVVLTDMSALTTADLNADGVTPNASGQQKMADSFAGSVLWAQVMGWIPAPAEFGLEAYQSGANSSAPTSAGTSPGVLDVEAGSPTGTSTPGSYSTAVTAPSSAPDGGGSDFSEANCTGTACDLQDLVTGDCLTVGSTVTATPCVPGDPAQDFDLTPASSGQGGTSNPFQIRTADGQCLTYNYRYQQVGGISPGSAVFAPCQSTPSQLWNKRLAARSAAANAGSPVGQNTTENSVGQNTSQP